MNKISVFTCCHRCRHEVIGSAICHANIRTLAWLYINVLAIPTAGLGGMERFIIQLRDSVLCHEMFLNENTASTFLFCSLIFRHFQVYSFPFYVHCLVNIDSVS